MKLAAFQIVVHLSLLCSYRIWQTTRKFSWCESLLTWRYILSHVPYDWRQLWEHSMNNLSHTRFAHTHPQITCVSNESEWIGAILFTQDKSKLSFELRCLPSSRFLFDSNVEGDAIMRFAHIIFRSQHRVYWLDINSSNFNQIDVDVGCTTLRIRNMQRKNTPNMDQARAESTIISFSEPVMHLCSRSRSIFSRSVSQENYEFNASI